MLTHPYILFPSFKLTIVYKWKEELKNFSAAVRVQEDYTNSNFFIYVCGVSWDSSEEQALTMLSFLET